MNRDLTVPERSQLGLIVVDENDVVSKVSEARACDQTDIARAYNRDSHAKTPAMACPENVLKLDASARKLGVF
jgi:hypothetical protein